MRDRILDVSDEMLYMDTEKYVRLLFRDDQLNVGARSDYLESPEEVIVVWGDESDTRRTENCVCNAYTMSIFFLSKKKEGRRNNKCG